MKRFLYVLVILILFCNFVQASDISDLLNSIKHQPDTKIDNIIFERFDIEKEKVISKLYPQIDALAGFEYHNSPVNLRPVPPTEANPQTDSLPFSKGVTKYGIEFKIPLFVKEIYTLKQKIEQQTKQFKYTKKMNLIARQATVVSLNGSLKFVEENLNYLEKRLESLYKTKEDVSIMVETGRLSESELYNIDNLILTLQTQKNILLGKKTEIIEDIYVLTGIRIEHALEMEENVVTLPVEDLKLRIAEEEAEIAKTNLKMSKEAYYPSLYLSGSYIQNMGEAYNTHDQIEKSYGTIMLNAKIPLFEKSILADIKSKKVDVVKSHVKLEKIKMETEATLNKIETQLKLIKENIKRSDEQILNAERLLKIAKVSYESGRMTVEEYLRFEVNLLNAQKDLYDNIAENWKLIAQKSLVNGNELTEVIK